jgi:hypothetical protein
MACARATPFLSHYYCDPHITYSHGSIPTTHGHCVLSPPPRRLGPVVLCFALLGDLVAARMRGHGIAVIWMLLLLLLLVGAPKIHGEHFDCD